MNQKGFIHVYTGNGKGKTTAALGLAFRAMGNQMKTYIGQFMKGQYYSELTSAKQSSPWITIEQYGDEKMICKDVFDLNDAKLASDGLQKVSAVLMSRTYQIVVLDEVLTAIHFNLLLKNLVLDLMKSKPANIELILTGRNAPQDIIDEADLVTEMKEIKHYFNTLGIHARAGIEK